MHADIIPRRWMGLLAAVLMMTGCAAHRPSAEGGMHLSTTPRAGAASALAGSSTPGAGEPTRRHRRREPRENATAATEGTVRHGATEQERQSATLTRQAVLGAMEDARKSTGALASALSRLAARKSGIGGANGVFHRHVAYGNRQLPWIHGALGGTALLASAASGLADAEMELGILRMTGPRLQAVLFGATLLAAWLDFLSLADAVLRQGPFYSVEKLFTDMQRVQRMIEPSMAALASMESGQVAAAATGMPALMGQLTREFHSIREGARVAAERGGQLMAAAQLVEMITLVSTLKMSLPRPPPAAPVTLGASLVMGSGGVMMGSRIVVSAEWVERMRRLVQAGVISVPVVSAAVRIHAGQVMMAQSHQDLPQGVRDALGDGPEVRAMHETGRTGAGMAEPPRHHVLPREHREWFEKRGFTGEMSIDQFCVELEMAHHQAIHGGGSWRQGRKWPGEWNQLIMKTLRDAETEVGRMLTRNEVLDIVAEYMGLYNIPMHFIPGRGA